MPVKHSGDGVEDEDDEKPTWQYFDSLLFLKDQCVPRHSTGNFDMSNSEETEEACEVNSMDEVVSEIDSEPPTPTSCSSTPQLQPLQYLKNNVCKKQLKQPMLLGKHY
ncbi:hypothetical protein JTB14_018762 [Gonioctena quinquepunctata]|nr:hypothetical protein JTB14_018762 [Gonioctena quinquepunctata]